MELAFNVSKQHIERADSEIPVAGSKNYLTAKFNFLTDEWTGTKTAIFKKGSDVLCVVLDEDDTCLVPWEVIKPGIFLVSVFCGDLVTTNQVKVNVDSSGYAVGKTPNLPTPDVYSQIITSMDDMKEDIEELKQSGGGSSNINPVAKTDEMTQPVGVDVNGALFTKPGSGGSADLSNLSLSLNGTSISLKNGDTVIGTPQTIPTASQADINSGVSAYMAEHPVSATVGDGSVTPIKTSFMKAKTKNLFNKDSDGNVSGYVKKSAGAPILSYAGYKTSHFIQIENGKTYCYPCAYALYGDSAKFVTCYKADQSYLEMITGVVDSNNKYVSFTITNPLCSYIRFSYTISSENTVMFVDADTMPNIFIAYGSIKYEIPDLEVKVEQTSEMYSQFTTFRNLINPLYGKKVTWDGDSIMRGQADYSFASIISQRNNMISENLSVGGATITAEVYKEGGIATHWISREYPNYSNDSDYIILNGGTNDADRLNSTNRLGLITTGFTDTYDDTTFCGAVEKMFCELIKKYPSKRIGFIISHKTGVQGGDKYKTGLRRTYFDKIVEICKKWGIPCLDLWNTSHLVQDVAECGSTMYIDGLHLSSAGYDYITPIVEAWMRTI